jgi:uncharacterized damage-inducible protein DinB
MSAELQHYLAFFESLHRKIGELLAGLPPEALNWRPTTTDGEATNSIAVLVTHTLGAERFWIGEIWGGRPVGREREAEFRVTVNDLATLQAALAEADSFLRAALSETPAERLELALTARGETVTGRWAVLHALEHTALHLGHLQLTAQLWRAQAAGPRE